MIMHWRISNSKQFEHLFDKLTKFKSLLRDPVGVSIIGNESNSIPLICIVFVCSVRLMMTQQRSGKMLISRINQRLKGLLLDIALPHGPPPTSILNCLNLIICDSFQVIGPSCRWSSSVKLICARPPFQQPFCPPVVAHSGHVSCPIPL